MNTIQSKCEKYMSMVVLKNASAVQVEETKRAFWAGALSIFSMYSRMAEDNVSDDAAVAMIQGWQDEFMAMFSEMEKKYSMKSFEREK